MQVAAPGREREYIPRVSLEDLSSETAEKPSYRHRRICIEGPIPHENIKNIIDWAPKLGFNSYSFSSGKPLLSLTGGILMRTTR